MDSSRKNGTKYVPVPPKEFQFKPGNPGGSAPRGKRISTWASEFGQKPPHELPVPGSKEFKALPLNAQIGLRRALRANKDDKLALLNTQYLEPRTLNLEDGGVGEGTIAAIAGAIIALKASGVALTRPEPIDAQVVVPIEPEATSVETEGYSEDEADDDTRSKRLYRNRTRTV